MALLVRRSQKQDHVTPGGCDRHKCESVVKQSGCKPHDRAEAATVISVEKWSSVTFFCSAIVTLKGY